MATTFRNFPSFPQRYMEPCDTAGGRTRREGGAAEAAVQPALYTESDLHVRQFTDAAAPAAAQENRAA